MHKKRSFYNITIGIGSQIVSIILGIIIPRMFLISYGSEINGFLNSISQVFTYFALLEAGVGAATLQALYGPVGKDDRRTTSEILAATNVYYCKTGKFYFFAVILLALIYPLIVKTVIPPVTMMLIILINGIPGIISYFVQGKYALLLYAEGKNYIITALNFASSTLISVIKIVLMYAGFNIVYVQLTYMLVNLFRILVLYIYIKKKYQWINLKCNPKYEAINQKNAALVNQICDLIFRNTDTILLTIFCGLKEVSIYSMYTLLFSMVRTVLDYIAQGFSFIMGQTYNQNLKKYERMHDLYETYRLALTFALYNIAYIFIIPFMRLYTSGIKDANYIDYKLSSLFLVFYLLTSSRVCSAELINYAQHFKLTQSRCIVEAIINLSVSIIAVRCWGIYGVLLGTIVALLYRTNDMILYANNRILKRSAWVTYRKLLCNTAIFVLLTICSSKVPWKLNSYASIILEASVSGIVILMIYFFAASIINKESFAEAIAILKRK